MIGVDEGVGVVDEYVEGCGDGLFATLGICHVTEGLDVCADIFLVCLITLASSPDM